ncbi:MAG: ABC transporter permease [Gaiellales bacterium]
MTVAPVDAAAGAVDAGVGQVRKELLRELVRSKTFVVGAVVVGFWLFCAIFGYVIAPHDPIHDQDLLNVNKGPSSAHWFGTDQIGRDVFSRVLTGSRSVIVIALTATVLGTILGTILGLITGFFRGIVDDVLSRIIEAVLVLPVVITALLVITAIGQSNVTMTICIGLLFMPVISRTVRAAVVSERELDYIAAAHLRRENSPYILFSELLPNVMAPILVEFTVRLGYAIFAVATLSFLGFGIQPPTPDWGSDIATNYTVITAGYWWEVLFGAAAIASLVIGVNLMADAIERVVDR